MPESYGIPRPPRVHPGMRIFRYKEGPQDVAPFIQAHDGESTPIFSTQVPVDRNLTKHLVAEIELCLRRDHHFAESFIERFGLILGEEIANPMQHGCPGTPVAIVVTALGRAPHRMVNLWVDNFLDPERVSRLTSPDRLPSMEDILYDSRGRGTVISSQMADGLYRVLLPGYHLMTIVHLSEST